MIINGAIVVLVWTGAVRVDNGYITQGEVVALINYMSQILVELVKLANLIININKSIACGNRIQSIFEMQPSITDGSGQKVDKVQTDTADRSEEAEYAVEFSHVGLTYAGAGDESLTDIDFKVKKGETIGIIGGTGSGKSSVVNLIPRFYDVTSGFIKVDGKDVKDYPLEELRGKLELHRLADSLIRRGRRPASSLVKKVWVCYKVAIVTVRARGQPPPGHNEHA